MDINTIINKLSIKEKLFQMFILGFQGEALTQNIKDAVSSGLGGVIYFAENLNSREKFLNLVKNLDEYSQINLFHSIDQEGGLVERTIRLDDRLEYLTPKALSVIKDVQTLKEHTQLMSTELKSLGINLNFAPVLDINTNPQNPVIGVRAFGNNQKNVIENAYPVWTTFAQNHIIPVGKHFPGHGEAFVDSHLDLPVINLPEYELVKYHIEPFKDAIKKGLDAVMVAHVHYSAFDSKKIPASLSENIINGYLRNKLEFEGLVISDDMVMGGITNHFKRIEALKLAIKAGVDLFIFKDSDKDILNDINTLAQMIENKEIEESRIDQSIERILKYKEKYGILNKQKNQITINVSQMRKQLENITIKTIETTKKGQLLPLQKNKNYLILSADKSQIYNYKFDKYKLSDFLHSENTQEVSYSLNPDVEKVLKQISQKDFDEVIFIGYNTQLNKNQIKLFEQINKPKILIHIGIENNHPCFNQADSIINAFCYNSISLKAIAKVLEKNFHNPKV